MGRYILRRLLISVLTLLLISFAIFALLDLSPGDPTASLPYGIPAETREQLRVSLGLDDPFLIRYAKWMRQFFVNEPLSYFEKVFDIEIGDSSSRLRLTSWSSRGFLVVDLIRDKLPQTMTVVGLAYLVSVLVAIPLGVIQAVKQYSFTDQAGTLLSILGFSVPEFFSALILLLVFSYRLKWLPTVYNTRLEVVDWLTFVQMVKQLTLPVLTLAFVRLATLARFTRSSVLDHLTMDYVTTARAKGFREGYVVVRHVLRNSLIPVITILAMGIPAIFGGAVIVEEIFRINGIGNLLINSLRNFDVPVIMSITLIMATLIVFFNLVADLLYGVLDPRIRYS